MKSVFYGDVNTKEICAFVQGSRCLPVEKHGTGARVFCVGTRRCYAWLLQKSYESLSLLLCGCWTILGYFSQKWQWLQVLSLPIEFSRTCNHSWPTMFLGNEPLVRSSFLYVWCGLYKCLSDIEYNTYLSFLIHTNFIYVFWFVKTFKMLFLKSVMIESGNKNWITNCHVCNLTII